ncbi:hypothetical protein E3983_00120 [Legionella israelensis]|uniref:Uncharacterized protein n=1 Tax=Legionella israelensis TaxID=454 RepID=A0AAX1EDG9_9GAMM|nr:hypothetical protein [Legionella israelensis]QBR82902.1 hypothetical protein E3983_00120 [Legionella israelensis]
MGDFLKKPLKEQKEPRENEIAQFKQRFKKLANNENSKLNKRESMRNPLLVNILIASSGVGGNSSGC